MHLLYTMARLYPFWAIPVGVILVEVGLFFRRRQSKAYLHCWALSCLFLFSAVGWIVFRGDLNSDHWLRAVFGA